MTLLNDPIPPKDSVATATTWQPTPSNPFATRFLNPSNNRFVGPIKIELERIVDQFFQSNLLGQIVGPHGCGKSTFTFEIERLIEIRHPRQFLFIRKTIDTNGSIRLDAPLFPAEAGRSMARTRILIMDGVERLPWLQRYALIRHCRQKKTGLLVTVHRPVWGFTELLRIEPALQTFLSVATDLQKHSRHKVPQEKLMKIYASSTGNIREALMACYDEWESQRCNSDCRDSD